jgi:hypothetical protein
MGNGDGANDERHGRGYDHGKAEVRNEISGEYIEGPVGQFGFVYGDVNLNPPRSPEEAAFRARYMARMQEEWDAKDKEEAARQQGPKLGGCAVAFLILWVMVLIFVIVMAIVVINHAPLF